MTHGPRTPFTPQRKAAIERALELLNEVCALPRALVSATSYPVADGHGYRMVMNHLCAFEEDLDNYLSGTANTSIEELLEAARVLESNTPSDRA